LIKEFIIKANYSIKINSGNRRGNHYDLQKFSKHKAVCIGDGEYEASGAGRG
jgi:hypothetical protein